MASPGHLGGFWSPPWSPRASPECPKRVLKIIPNPFLSLVCLWGVPGMPPGSPIDPERHQKVKKTPTHVYKKYKSRRTAARNQCVLKCLQKAPKKHGGGFARSAIRLGFKLLDTKATQIRNEDWILDATGCRSQKKGFAEPETLQHKIKTVLRGWGIHPGAFRPYGPL